MVFIIWPLLKVIDYLTHHDIFVSIELGLYNLGPAKSIGLAYDGLAQLQIPLWKAGLLCASQIIDLGLNQGDIEISARS